MPRTALTRCRRTGRRRNVTVIGRSYWCWALRRRCASCTVSVEGFGRRGRLDPVKFHAARPDCWMSLSSGGSSGWPRVRVSPEHPGEVAAEVGVGEPVRVQPEDEQHGEQCLGAGAPKRSPAACWPLVAVGWVSAVKARGVTPELMIRVRNTPGLRCLLHVGHISHDPRRRRRCAPARHAARCSGG